MHRAAGKIVAIPFMDRDRTDEAIDVAAEKLAKAALLKKDSRLVQKFVSRPVPALRPSSRSTSSER